MNIHALSYKIRPGVPLYVEDDRLVTILAHYDVAKQFEWRSHVADVKPFTTDLSN